jgi:fructuronate reductase/mannitol 2-dehydrogenase
VEALDRRRRAGLPGFTILSCDNMAGNGAITRVAVLSFARLRDERLARWIERNVSFPSSMVDRITPRTTPEDRARLEREFGVADRWPVVTEPFSQWVVEDDFCNGRPPLDQVGVQYVADVRPYSLMKTRLLNAGHCAMGFLGGVAGVERMDAAMADPLLREYLSRLMGDEVAPLLPEVPGTNPNRYVETLLERLANPNIGDRLARLCRAGSVKVPSHLVPSIVEARALGRPHDLLTLAVAGWFRYLRGVDENGRAIAIDDEIESHLRPLAATGADPRALLARRSLFGALSDDPEFAAAVGEALGAIDRQGVRGAIAAVLAPSDLLAA